MYFLQHNVELIRDATDTTRTEHLLACDWIKLTAELAAAREQATGWTEAAKQYLAGMEFYQGLIRQVGELFGDAAKTSDDGSVQQDVLALKVPELVKQQQTELATAKRRIADLELFSRAESPGEGYWAWQGDGEDHLESLVCPVLIRPEQLRAIVDELAAARALLAKAKQFWVGDVLIAQCHTGKWRVYSSAMAAKMVRTDFPTAAAAVAAAEKAWEVDEGPAAENQQSRDVLPPPVQCDNGMEPEEKGSKP